MTNPENPLVSELASALERIKVLEAQAEAAQRRATTPEEQEQAMRQQGGEALLDAIHKAKAKNALPSAFVEAFGGGQGS